MNNFSLAQSDLSVGLEEEKIHSKVLLNFTSAQLTTPILSCYSLCQRSRQIPGDPEQRGKLKSAKD